MSGGGKTRKALDDALNGDAGAVDRAVVRGLRAIATAVDEIETRLDSIQNRMVAMALSVSASVIGAAILLALRK